MALAQRMPSTYARLMATRSDRAVAPFPDEGRPPGTGRMARAARVDHLAAVPLFAGCSKRQLRHVAAATHHQLIEADQALVAEGGRSREAYVIVAGRAVARRNGRKISDLGAGSFVGELGLLLDRPHAATVITTTPVEVLALDRRSLALALDEVPGLGWALIQTIAARIDDEARSRPSTR